MEKEKKKKPSNSKVRETFVLVYIFTSQFSQKAARARI